EALSACLPEAELPEITRSISLMLGLGLDPPVDEQAILLFAARRLVECLGVQRPTLFLFEDVHWADAGQLDLIQYVAAHAREAPVLLLALARPELMEARPSWGQGLWAHTAISLDPLPDTEAAAVVGHLVGEDLPAHADPRRLLRHAPPSRATSRPRSGGAVHRGGCRRDGPGPGLAPGSPLGGGRGVVAGDRLSAAGRRAGPGSDGGGRRHGPVRAGPRAGGGRRRSDPNPAPSGPGPGAIRGF